MNSELLDNKYLKMYSLTKNMKDFEVLVLFAKILAHRCKEAGGPVFEVAKCALHAASVSKVGQQTLCESKTLRRGKDG